MFVDQIRERATIIIWLSCIAAIGFILYAWNFLPLFKNIESSNMAYIRANHVLVSNLVEGEITKIHVIDYEKVEEGQPLFEIMDVNTKAKHIINAPTSGQVGLIRLYEGQYLNVGTTMLVIIKPEFWVIASFKETQINNIHIGQKAKIKIDAIKGRVFDAIVSEIAPATGIEFSVIKPEDSIGNFVKLTQKIAVRLDFDKLSEADVSKLKAGMSANVEIDTRSYGFR
ncbi:HlyD family secretion protein [Bartonella sp. DGB1]|uniref:HlyD family secretion protein n=1 Tax=Bartonella sp. DGB1 TaxID=3239807 RepID=UPI0035235943